VNTNTHDTMTTIATSDRFAGRFGDHLIEDWDEWFPLS
jgi:hypothetical protein